ELVETLVRLGRAGDAAAIAEQYDAIADEKGQPWARARAARAHGFVAPDDAFEAAFEESLSLHDQTPDLYEAARTRLAYGARLRREGHRARAREELRAAIDLFDRLGAAPWSDAARAELCATGETARRRNPTTLDDLT